MAGAGREGRAGREELREASEESQKELSKELSKNYQNRSHERTGQYRKLKMPQVREEEFS